MFSSSLLFLDIGGPEIMLIMLVALLLFGGDKLPELARGLGKGIRDFKDASDGVKREINNQIDNYESKKTETPVVVNEVVEPGHEESATVHETPVIEGHVANTIPAGESHVANDSPEMTHDHANLENIGGIENHTEATHVSAEHTKEEYKS